MKRRELEIAQFLLGTFQRAQQLAEKIDPRRARRNYQERDLDALATKASDSFWMLVGRHPNQVDMTELNLTSPADWTKLDYEGRRTSCPR